VVFLAAYSENTPIAGYFKEEWGPFNVFSFQDGLAYWQQDLKIENMTETEISKMMEDFDKSVPRPNGSSLFFYPENYKAKIDYISSYDPSVEEVVEQCLSYKIIL
jgi:hypothetical protein